MSFSIVELGLFRCQNRWLLVEFISVGQNKPTTIPLEGKQIWAALKQSVLTNFGDTGWGAVGLSLTGEDLPLSCF